MFDAKFFNYALPREIEAAGGTPVVELALNNGHVHRLRSVIEAADGYVTVATYQVRGDLTHERPRFGNGKTGLETLRVVVAYESISAIVFDPSVAQVKSRPGFASS